MKSKHIILKRKLSNYRDATLVSHEFTSLLVFFGLRNTSISNLETCIAVFLPEYKTLKIPLYEELLFSVKCGFFHLLNICV